MAHYGNLGMGSAELSPQPRRGGARAALPLLLLHERGSQEPYQTHTPLTTMPGINLPNGDRHGVAFHSGATSPYL